MMNINNNFQNLEYDEDVLLIIKDTFTVGRLKELVTQEFLKIFLTTVNAQTNCTIFQIFKNVSIGESEIKAGDIIWNSSSEGIKCQLLRVGDKSWKKGKITFHISIKFLMPKEPNKIEVNLKFFPEPDGVLQSDSSLDDIRPMKKGDD